MLMRHDAAMAVYETNHENGLCAFVEKLLDPTYLRVHHRQHICDIICFLAERADLEQLVELPALSKAHMLRILSHNINRSDDKGSEECKRLVRAGQKYTIASQVPDEVFNRFIKSEERLLALLEDHVNFQKHDPASLFHPKAELTQPKLQEFAQTFIGFFADAYKVETGIALGREEDLMFSGNWTLFGQQYWNAENRMPVVEIGFRHFIKPDDMVNLVGVLGHECMHAHNQYIDRSYAGIEFNKDHKPDLYIFRSLVDKNFYTMHDDDIYRNHPEEVFVERVGLRLAVQFAKMIDVVLNTDAMKRIGYTTFRCYKRPEQAFELARLFDKHGGVFPAHELAPGENAASWHDFAESLRADIRNCGRKKTNTNNKI